LTDTNPLALHHHAHNKTTTVPAEAWWKIHISKTPALNCGGRKEKGDKEMKKWEPLGMPFSRFTCGYSLSILSKYPWAMERLVMSSRYDGRQDDF
jgi:hypothetical protein